MKRAVSLLMLSSTLALSGCITLLPEPGAPPRLYPLEADDAARSPDAMVVDAVAVVALPTGPQVLMSEGIVWRRDGVIAYMDGAAWPGRTPDLLQALLAQTITRDGRMTAGVRAGEGLRGDVEVRWDLIAFEVVEQGGALDAHFAAHVRVMQTRGRRLLHSEIVDLREPLEGRTGMDAAEALVRAARRASDAIALMTANAAQQLDAEAPAAE